jgi:hypothetical protein
MSVLSGAWFDVDREYLSSKPEAADWLSFVNNPLEHADIEACDPEDEMFSVLAQKRADELLSLIGNVGSENAELYLRVDSINYIQ